MVARGKNRGINRQTVGRQTKREGETGDEESVCKEAYLSDEKLARYTGRFVVLRQRSWLIVGCFGILENVFR